MEKDYKIENIIRRNLKLYEERKKIMALPAEKALNAILDSELPATLVQSFPDDDLHFLIHDIGVDDAIPVLALAASSQWEYILDVEVWKKDRISLPSVTRWLNLLMTADSNRTVNWLLAEKIEFIEYYLLKHIDVVIREKDQDPSDFGDEYFTFDDYFYVRHAGMSQEEALLLGEDAAEPDDFRESVVYRLIQHMSQVNNEFYQSVLLEAMSVISAEVEEEDFRLRSVRLAEKGFLPYYEAVGIYTPLSLEDFIRQGAEKMQGENPARLDVPVPLYHFSAMEGENIFAGALRAVDNESDMMALQVEFAALCNLLISADQKIVKGKAELKHIVDKACGYLSTGLELLAGEKSQNVAEVSALIRKYKLNHLFRLGYGLAVKLKWAAEKWQAASWFKSRALSLSFWGEQWVGVLGGLLIKRPLYFDNYKSGVLYREFKSLEDIRITGRSFAEIRGFDGLLSRMDLPVESFAGFFLTCRNLLLTSWASERTTGEEGGGPLSIEAFREFFQTLWEDETGEEKKGLKKIKTSEKELFLKWLSRRSGESCEEISQRLGHGLESIFNEIEEEYGAVALKDLDPRYITLFCLRSAGEE